MEALSNWQVADNVERQMIGAIMLQKARRRRLTGDQPPTLGLVEQADNDKAFSNFYSDLQALLKQMQAQPAQ